MTDMKTTKDRLLAAGHDASLIDRTAQTADQLKSILHKIPQPKDDDLKSVFEDNKPS